MGKVKKSVLCAIFSALALISFMIENLFPPLIVPGGRIGISNIFILLAGIICGTFYGFLSLIIKSVLGSIFAGNISAILYSLPAGTIAYFIQIALVFYTKNISVTAASVLGGVINACVQNAAFCLITGTTEYFIYIPYLALLGVIGGAIVGISVYIIIKIIPQKAIGIKDQTT